MANTKSIEIKVGIMVGVGLALFMITTLLLGGGKKVLKSSYLLKVQFESVTGVTPGSVVQLLGIPVGNVKSVKFASENTLIEVILEIDKTYKDRITEGSVAGTRTQGALGDKYIFITPGAATNPSLENGALLESEKGGDIFATITEKGAEIQRIFDMLGEAHRLIANLNADGKSAQLMPNLVKSSEELHQVLSEFKLLAQDIRGGENGGLKGSMARLESVLTKLDKGQGTLGALINDKELHERIKSALGGSTRSSYIKNQVRETIKAE